MKYSPCKLSSNGLFLERTSPALYQQNPTSAQRTRPSSGDAIFFASYSLWLLCVVRRLPGLLRDPMSSIASYDYGSGQGKLSQEPLLKRAGVAVGKTLFGMDPKKAWGGFGPTLSAPLTTESMCRKGSGGFGSN